MRKAALDGFGRSWPSIDESPPPIGGAVTVKADDVAVPALVVTTMLATPRGAVAGMAVVIEDALLVVMAAAMPAIVTDAPARPVPLMVTGVFGAPADGETVLMVGGGGASTVKAKEAAVKVGTVTTTLPAPTVAAAGTVAVITVPVFVILAAVPPMVTVAPLKPDPLMVTVEPTAPLAGDTVLIIGAVAGGGARTVKAKLAGARPATVTTTLPAPTVAADGTLVVIAEPVLPMTLAAAPPMVTLAPFKLAPLMVTPTPGIPLPGETVEIVGGEAGVPEHPAVLMLMVPAPKVTVAEAHAAPLTLTVCA